MDRTNKRIDQTARRREPGHFRNVSRLFIIIKAVPRSSDRRGVMRATWLPGLSSENVTYRFFSEQPSDETLGNVEREAAIYNDMVVFNQ
jgi:hypothetical protein